MDTVKFKKIAIDLSNKCEACSVFDVNDDGTDDIVCGEYWYEGPDFTNKHKICDITNENGYIWDFSDFPMDVNGNGRMDILTGSWFGDGIYWRENPGDDSEWKNHKICDSSCVETIRFFDIDGDGELEIFPHCPMAPVYYLKLIKDENGNGTGAFEKYVLTEFEAGHGFGVGDVDSDGKLEIILKSGILHMPKGGADAGLWDFMPEFELNGSPSVPIIVYDVNGDGLNDIIAGSGHDFGLFWWEQGKDADGNRRWTRHVIDSAWSQYHDMQLIDIDGDGELELLTGKRWMAHNGNDPGDSDDVFVCYYKINREKQQIYRHVIDCGDATDGYTGVGLYFWTSDLTGNGKPDIIAPGKEGLYVLYNL